MKFSAQTEREERPKTKDRMGAIHARTVASIRFCKNDSALPTYHQTGSFSFRQTRKLFPRRNKKSIPEPQVQTDLTTETTEAVSDAEDQTPVEPTHIITPTEHTDGIFFGE